MKAIRLIVSLLLVTAVLLTFGGCFKFKIDDIQPSSTTGNGASSQLNSLAPTAPGSTAPASDVNTVPGDTNTQNTQNQQNPATAPSGSQTPVTQAPPATAAPPVTAAPVQADNPASWTKAQIVEKLGAAVNKSKAYTGELDVDHTESFDAQVTKITGGQALATIASKLIGLVTKPTNETLHYSGGRATNSEGENVPILLPKRNNFCLSPDGVAEASAVKNDQGVLITVKLVQEVADIDDVPLYHSQCMGYLDANSLGVLDKFDKYDVTFTYSGSTLTVQINNNGYVTSAKYFIPMHFEGTASKGILSGSGIFDGSQTEVWTLKW